MNINYVNKFLWAGLPVYDSVMFFLFSSSFFSSPDRQLLLPGKVLTVCCPYIVSYCSEMFLFRKGSMRVTFRRYLVLKEMCVMSLQPSAADYTDR